MIPQFDEPELTRPVNGEDDYSLAMMIDAEQSPDKNSTEQAPLL